MSDSVRSTHRISRRGFLKATGAAAGALGVAGALSVISTEEWQANAEAAETTACTYHQSHCGGMCSLKCTVRDGRMVKIEPNPAVDKPWRTICLKGISEISHIYGQGRVQAPLKRVGERGSGQFERISWD